MALTPKAFADIITFTRSSGGGRFNSAGVYEFLATDAPRLDHDPVTLLPRGLLIEEQRTNLLLRSEEFDNAYWTKSNANVALNAIASPGGTLNADKLIESADSNVHIVFRTYGAAVIGTSYTYTVFVKAAERESCFIRFGMDSSFFGAKFNLTDGSITEVTPTLTASVMALKDGWFRCSITRTANTTASIVAYNYINQVGSYLGDGTSGIYIWGAQLETGAFPTSYIPTVAAQVTRAADVASVNTLSPWYNATEGTLFVDTLSSPGGAIGNIAAALSAGTGAEYIYTLLRTDTNANRILTVRDDNVQQVGIDIITPIGSIKAAGAYKLNDFAAAVNGGAAVADSTGTIPSPITLQIGRLNGGNYWNGHIRSLKYYPRRLSNDELQAITV